MSRITELSYLPSDQDILWCYVKTSGISKSKYTIGATTLSFLDPGGRRSERKKWIRMFRHPEISVMLFFVDAGSYDEILCEAPTFNRMEDGFLVFDAVCNLRLVADARIIVFLHKIDKLEPKLASIPFRDGDRYKGDPHSVEDVKAYLRDRVLSIAKRSRPGSDIEVHFTSINDAQGLGKLALDSSLAHARPDDRRNLS
ncbi:hypothetical protein VTN00DRAFT_4356 [Thermoascus crustaceus]|uniref:uncharacterized protein n=1 Tax=Thermoascus crustaceus TaxID=5088 RepID=UPI0037430D1A